MRNFKVKTTVIKNFNDSKTGISYEKDEPITLDRARYEELLSKGFVNKGEEVREEKNLIIKKDEE